MAQASKRWHTRRSLGTWLKKSIRVEDFATEFPIEWLEETNEAGVLADGPGLGTRAVWMNSDCSMSSGFEVSCADPCFSHDDYRAAVERAVSAAVSQISFGEEGQFLFFPWDEAHSMLRRFRATAPDDPAYIQWWRKARTERELARMRSGDLRTFKSWFMLNSSPSAGDVTIDPYDVGGAKGPFQKLIDMSSILGQNLNGYEKGQYAAFAHTVTKRIQSLEMVMGAGGLLRTDPVRAMDLFQFLRRMWAYETWEHDGMVPNRTHVIPRVDARFAPFGAYFMRHTIEDDGYAVKVGDFWHRVLVLHTLPKECDVGLFAQALIGPEMVKGIREMVVSLVFKPADKVTETEKLRKRIRVLNGQMKNNVEHADNAAMIFQLQKRIEDLRNATRPTMYNTYMHVHLWHRDRAVLEQREHNIKSALTSSLEAIVEGEDYENLPFLIGFGQPGYTRYQDNSRLFTNLASEVACLAPVSCYTPGCIGYGADDPVPLVVETDYGAPHAIDLWAPGRFTMLGGFGVGAPGSGKTNFYQQLIKAQANRGTDIIIMDGADQPGFDTLVELLGGQRISAEDDRFRINPLATRIENGIQANPTSDELDDILVNLGAMFSPGAKLKPFETSVLTSAVKYAFEKRPGDGSRVVLEHLLPGLNADRFHHDAEGLIAYTYRRILEETWLGRYGTLMSGTEDIPHHWLTLFDVRSLMKPGQEQLQAVIVSYLLRYVERASRMNLARVGRAKRKILALVDEAWKAAKTPAMANQIFTMYRTGRARNLSPHLLSQGMADVRDLVDLDKAQSGGGDASRTEQSPILNCAAHTFLFNVSEGDAKIAAELFNLTADQRDVLVSQGSDKENRYREFVHLLRTSDSKVPRTFTRLRSRLLPEELWATTTNAGHIAKRGELQQKLRQELVQDARARARFADELTRAGWPAGSQMNDDALINALTIHRLAHKS